MLFEEKKRLQQIQMRSSFIVSVEVIGAGNGGGGGRHI